MTSEVYPIHDQTGSLRKLARVLRGLAIRLGQLDLRYQDPWEQKRRR